MEIVRISQDSVEKIQKILSQIIEAEAFDESWNGRTVRIKQLDGPTYEPSWMHLGDWEYQLDDATAAMLVNALDVSSKFGYPEHHWDVESGTVIYWTESIKRHRSLQKHLDYMLPYRVHVPDVQEVQEEEEVKNGN